MALCIWLVGVAILTWWFDVDMLVVVWIGGWFGVIVVWWFAELSWCLIWFYFGFGFARGVLWFRFLAFCLVDVLGLCFGLWVV